MALQYKTTGSWTDIPTAALYSTYGGSYHVEYPLVEDMTLAGAPCGAFGKGVIVIRAPWMQDAGFDFWRDLISSGTQYAALNLEVWDQRKGAVTKYAGYLMHPTFESLSYGSSTSNTIYHNVEIRMIECAVTT